MIKLYTLGDRLVAVRRGSELTYVFQDHLGSLALETDATGNVVTRFRYQPYGTIRGTEWTLPIDRGFTGQVIERGLGLHDYVARHYAQPLGRWIAPDTVVPEPNNPQDLNRYTYARNNPLRYTDPTGMFSEEEIMAYLGVETWEEVLVMFEEGGIYEGQWGWLEVLRTAEVGDKVYFVSGQESTDLSADSVAFQGSFAQMNGQLVFIDREGDTVDPATLVLQLNHEGYVVTRPGRGWYGPGKELPLRYLERTRQYQHLRSVNWNEALNPVELADMAKVVGAPLTTFALTLGFVGIGLELCTTVVGCVAGAELAIPGGGSAAVSTWYLVIGAKLYVEHYLQEVVEYGP